MTARIIAAIFFLCIFGRAILSFGLEIISRPTLRLSMTIILLCWIFFTATGLSFSRKNLLSGVVLAALSLITYKLLGSSEEMFHAIIYAALGSSLYRDLKGGKSPLLSAIALGSMIGAADELFQYLIPWRVGDLRDVVLNIVAVSWGVMADKMVNQPNIANTESID